MATSRQADPAEKAVKEIRSFYELGNCVLDRAKRDEVRLDAAARAVAEEKGVSEDREKEQPVREAVQREGPAETLRAVPCPGAHADIGQPHPPRAQAQEPRGAARVAEAGRRERVVHRPARQGDSRLESEGAGGQGGPRMNVPKDLNDALAQVLHRTDEWLKRYDGVWLQDENWPPVIGFGAADPAKLANRLKELRIKLATGQRVGVTGKASHHGRAGRT